MKPARRGAWTSGAQIHSHLLLLFQFQERVGGGGIRGRCDGLNDDQKWSDTQTELTRTLFQRGDADCHRKAASFSEPVRESQGP